MTLAKLCNFLLVAILSQPLLAVTVQNGVESAAPTTFLDVHYSLTTYKSKLLISNDTGSSLDYALGGWAGEERDFGFLYRTETASTTFALNSSSAQNYWQDTVLRYRLTYFFLGVNFARSGFTAKANGTPTLDVVSSGIGGNFGFFVPVGKRGVFFMDAMTASYSDPKDGLGGKASLGARTDIDLGGTISITKSLLDFMIGYRQRTFSVTSGLNFQETLTSTYCGFRIAYFY